MRDTTSLLVALGATLVLTACGGSSYSDPEPPMPDKPADATEVPATAGASSTALVSYLGGLAATETTTEALSLDKVSPTSSETEEPLAVPK
jgi:hypothetical protein